MFVALRVVCVAKLTIVSCLLDLEVDHLGLLSVFRSFCAVLSLKLLSATVIIVTAHSFLFKLSHLCGWSNKVKKALCLHLSPLQVSKYSVSYRLCSTSTKTSQSVIPKYKLYIGGEHVSVMRCYLNETVLTINIWNRWKIPKIINIYTNDSKDKSPGVCILKYNQFCHETCVCTYNVFLKCAGLKDFNLVFFFY